MTARFVIGPLLGYDADESPIKIANGGDSGGMRRLQERKALPEKLSSSQKLRKKTHPEQTSARRLKKDMPLQFGVFTSKEAAEKLASDLKPKV